MFRNLKQEEQADYIDLATDLLPLIAMPGFSPTLGAYRSDDLIGWILHKANEPDVHLLIIDQIEPLLATFERMQTVEFFQMAGQIEPRRPVVLLTYLSHEVQEAAFPMERLQTV